MNTSALYNTHRHIKRIVETGVSEDTAEAIVDSVTDLMATNIATKADLSQMATRLIKWVVGTGAALALALTGVIASVIFTAFQMFQTSLP